MDAPTSRELSSLISFGSQCKSGQLAINESLNRSKTLGRHLALAVDVVDVDADADADADDVKLERMSSKILSLLQLH